MGASAENAVNREERPAPPSLLPVDGVLAAACAAGVYPPPRDDLALFSLAPGAAVSAVFTRNRLRAAPVVAASRNLARRRVRYLLVNSGNANAATGAAGIADAERTCRAVAALGGCEPEAVLPFSTGVIGERLPVDKICRALPGLHERLDAAGWGDCARAIMTTDTTAKGYSDRFDLEGTPVTVTGIAKGAGMIKPDMATMLAFIATDAAVAQDLLDRLLRTAVAQSFNKICVDGDTSTNDACVLVAAGKRPGAPLAAADSAAYRLLESRITGLCIRLAQALVRDAEGATKFVTLRVEGGADDAECAAAATALATSPLVKTALYGADPNWGRMLAAVGRSGLPDLDMDRVALYLGEVRVVQNGARDPEYAEEQGAAAMAQEDVLVRVVLGRGAAAADYWTCDLSPEYVAVNTAYRS